MPAYGASALTATTVLLVGDTVAGAPINPIYYNIANPNGVIAYIQFFDAASTGAVTLGTTAPTFWIAAAALGGVTDSVAGLAYPFKRGIVVAATTTPTGATALTSTCAVTVITK